MPTATLTSKGQFTLPKAVRERLGLHAGDRIAVDLDEARGVAMLRPLNRTAKEVFGLLRARAPVEPVSVERMREAVRERLRRRQAP
jgi:AbrB family looped-hinge helix DNA binding protein